jgi:hypothetical protein
MNTERIRLEARRGRIHMILAAQPLGRDLAVTLSGGDREHIGAVAVCQGSQPGSVMTLPGHREDQLALEVASKLARHLDAVVSVSCGIHLDAITSEEIQAVLELAQDLTRSLLDQLPEAGS